MNSTADAPEPVTVIAARAATGGHEDEFRLRSASTRPRAWLSSRTARAGYAEHVSAERDELRELVERLPDEEVPAVLSVARRHLGDPSGRAWPPAFFGSGRAERTDVAERAEELLDEGFGQPA